MKQAVFAGLVQRIDLKSENIFFRARVCVYGGLRTVRGAPCHHLRNVTKVRLVLGTSGTRDCLANG